MPTPKPPANRAVLKNITLFTEDDEPSGRSNAIPVSKIVLPSQQPRRYFDTQKLAGLVESVRQHGVLEPLIVRPLASGKYELVAGERRYRAAQQVGLSEVPVVIREMNDQEALQFALIENLQREDLNPVEETEGILQLLALQLEKVESEVSSLLHRMLDEEKGKVPHNVMGSSEAASVQAVFEGLGLMSWQSFISNRLPLLNLPEEILEALRSGKIAYTKAQAIARIKDPDQRRQLLEDAIAGDWSLSQIKERIAALRSTPKEEDSQTLSSRADQIAKFLKKKKTLDDPKKQQRLEKLLAEMQTLLFGE